MVMSTADTLLGSTMLPVSSNGPCDEDVSECTVTLILTSGGFSSSMRALPPAESRSNEDHFKDSSCKATHAFVRKQ